MTSASPRERLAYCTNRFIGTICAMTRSREIKNFRLERFTALDGLPSEWGEFLLYSLDSQSTVWRGYDAATSGSLR